MDAPASRPPKRMRRGRRKGACVVRGGQGLGGGHACVAIKHALPSSGSGSVSGASAQCQWRHVHRFADHHRARSALDKWRWLLLRAAAVATTACRPAPAPADPMTCVPTLASVRRSTLEVRDTPPLTVASASSHSRRSRSSFKSSSCIHGDGEAGGVQLVYGVVSSSPSCMLGVCGGQQARTLRVDTVQGLLLLLLPHEGMFSRGRAQATPACGGRGSPKSRTICRCGHVSVLCMRRARPACGPCPAAFTGGMAGPVAI
jgi:hypothetical protein